MKVIIIGGVAGGIGTATRIKRLNEDAEVIVLEQGEYVSFANCGLPYHISKVIPNRSDLVLQTSESLSLRSGIDVRTSHRAVKIDRENKLIKIIDLKTNNEYTENYDYLVLATGAKSIKPPIDGINDPSVKYLQTIPDMDDIIKSLKGSVKKVAVIGGGFIGLEATENIIEAGHHVSLIERDSQVMTSLDPEMSQYIVEELKSHGVTLFLNQGLQKIERTKENLTLHLNDTQISADIVIMAVGVIPNSELAEDANLLLNNRKGVVVNEYLQTSDPNIYAVGDVIETYNIPLKSKGMIPLAAPATKQARIVAENICGGKKIYKGVNPTAICKIFSIVAGSTGATEKQLQESKYHKVYVHPSNHPSYYPNSSQMHIKLIYDESGIVLGAQIVGKEGVDKRIDIFALALRNQISVYDLSEQDFAYAPPFGAPRDPVHVASFVAINQLEGLTDPVFDLNILDSVILDVREYDEVSLFAIKDSVHIPLGELRERFVELDSSKNIIIICASGLRSYLAERILKQKNYKVYNYSGGTLCLKMKDLIL